MPGRAAVHASVVAGAGIAAVVGAFLPWSVGLSGAGTVLTGYGPFTLISGVLLVPTAWAGRAGFGVGVRIGAVFLAVLIIAVTAFPAMSLSELPGLGVGPGLIVTLVAGLVAMVAAAIAPTKGEASTAPSASLRAATGWVVDRRPGSVTAVQETRPCPNCGVLQSISTERCTNCWRPLEPIHERGHPSSSSVRSRRMTARRLVVFAGVTLAIVVTVVAGVAIFAPRGGVGSGRGNHPIPVIEDESGGASLTIADLPPGTCHDVRTGSNPDDLVVDVRPCADPHLFELMQVVTVPMPAGAPYPDDLDSFANSRCADVFNQYVGVPDSASTYTYVYGLPSPSQWSLGERRIPCEAAPDDPNGTLAATVGDPSIGSAVAGSRPVLESGYHADQIPVGSIPPESTTSKIVDLPPGACHDLARGSGPGLVAVVHACADPHSLELMTDLTYPAAAGAPYPGQGAIDTFAGPWCAVAFARYVGMAATTSIYAYAFSGPSPSSWAAGERRISCEAGSDDPTSKLTASVAGADR